MDISEVQDWAWCTNYRIQLDVPGTASRLGYLRYLS